MRKIQLKIKNIYFAVWIVIFSFTLFALSSREAGAAELSLFADSAQVTQGELVDVVLQVDPEDESVNALEGKISFPDDILSLKGIEYGDSVVNWWVKQPSLLNKNEVVFSGVMLGGFEGMLSPFWKGYRPGQVLVLNFLARRFGTASFEISGARVLLHNGRGEEAELSTPEFILRIAEGEPGVPFSRGALVSRDKEPPESFTPLVTRSSNLFGGRWFLSFLAQDKSSGVASYQVAEEGGGESKNFSGLSWAAVQSPYLLRDQSLSSFIYVKAVDQVGNERVAVVRPSKEGAKFIPTVWLIIIAALILLIWIARKRLLFFTAVIILVLGARGALAATLFVEPMSGEFVSGDTFDVSVLLDTAGETVNAVSASLAFPPDKLQVVSPVAGKSIIGIWVLPPRFDNQTGILNLQGLIPDGIKTAKGLLTTVTFRARAPGPAVLRFLDSSEVYRHDGQGTPILHYKLNGSYGLIASSPKGPAVYSETHPDEARWYKEATVALRWDNSEDKNARGYSYLLDGKKETIPDDTPESGKDSVTYYSLLDGVYYFHIKTLGAERSGETTNFRLNIDRTPPAEFALEVIPAARTKNSRPVIQFMTTDALSGLGHYELKIFPLQPLFTEVQSPYVSPKLPPGSYEVAVRAYDAAGNYRDIVQRLSIIGGFFDLSEIFGAGGGVLLSWPLVIVILGLILLLAAALLLRKSSSNRRSSQKSSESASPE